MVYKHLTPKSLKQREKIEKICGLELNKSHDFYNFLIKKYSNNPDIMLSPFKINLKKHDNNVVFYELFSKKYNSLFMYKAIGYKEELIKNKLFEAYKKNIFNRKIVVIPITTPEHIFLTVLEHSKKAIYVVDGGEYQSRIAYKPYLIPFFQRLLNKKYSYNKVLLMIPDNDYIKYNVFTEGFCYVYAFMLIEILIKNSSKDTLETILDFIYHLWHNSDYLKQIVAYNDYIKKICKN